MTPVTFYNRGWHHERGCHTVVHHEVYGHCSVHSLNDFWDSLDLIHAEAPILFIDEYTLGSPDEVESLWSVCRRTELQIPTLQRIIDARFLMAVALRRWRRGTALGKIAGTISLRQYTDHILRLNDIPSYMLTRPSRKALRECISRRGAMVSIIGDSACDRVVTLHLQSIHDNLI